MTNARKTMKRCKEEKLTFSARIKNCSASMLEREGCIERIHAQLTCLKGRLDEVRTEMLTARGGDGMREACIQDMRKLRAKVKHLHAQSTIEKLGMQATSSTLSRILYEYYLADREMIRHSVLLKHRKLRSFRARGGGGWRWSFDRRASIYARHEEGAGKRKKIKNENPRICLHAQDQQWRRWGCEPRTYIQQKWSRMLYDWCYLSSRPRNDRASTSSYYATIWPINECKFSCSSSSSILSVLMHDVVVNLLLEFKACFWVSKFRAYTPWSHFASQNVSSMAIPNA